MRHGRYQAQAEQLRALTERLEQAREAERSRIARELHDELGQILTGIKLDFARSVRQFKHWNAPPDVVESIQSAMMNIDLNRGEIAWNVSLGEGSATIRDTRC